MNAPKQQACDRANSEAARVILSDVERYGGEGSLMVIWARAFQCRAAIEQSQQAEPSSQRRLFAKEAA